MIIYNTTFHAHREAVKPFLEWLRNEYIPAAVGDGRLADPRLSLVLNAEESDGSNYSLQFRVVDIGTLQKWYEETGNAFVEELSRRFGQQVAGFSTLLEEVELK